MIRIADLLTRETPHARKVIVPDAAHLLPMECPAPFNQLVIGFLGSTWAFSVAK